MGVTSFAAIAGLLLVAACGGTEFSSGGGGEGGTPVGAGGASGDTQGPSGGAGTTMSAGGAGGAAGGMIDASVIGGSGGQPVMDAGPRPDVSGGSGGVTVVEASADVGALDTGVVPTCPLTEPGGGGPCSGALKCIYGTHPRISCRKTYTCTAGHWAIAPSVACPDLGPCTNEQPLPFIGAVCMTAGHDCVWDTGLYCRCLACPDASCPKWSCFPPPNGCGTTPPNYGQRCDASAVTSVCEFGDCSLGTRVTVTCVNGIVNWTFPNCQ